MSLGAFTAAAQQPTSVEHPWLSMDALTEPPVHFETRIPAQATLTEDAPPGHQKALCVTVPDMGRDEKACAFTVDLPELSGEYNAARLWLKGGEKTTRLEIVFVTDAGTYGREVDLRPEWRQVTLGPNNTRPYFGTRGGRLDVTKASRVRFCFGEWQGNVGGPHAVYVGPMMAVVAPGLAPPREAESLPSPRVPLPLQPFTVDLLDLQRGRWNFADALGQRLELDGPVVAYAFADGEGMDLRLGWLCCDPEFPDDPTHAVLRVAPPTGQDGTTTWFRIEEPYFQAAVEVSAISKGAFLCRLWDITLGPATPGDRYVAGMYLLMGGKPFPLWLAPDADETALNPRLLTDRVGNIFNDGEPVQVTLVAWHPEKAATEVVLEAKDYATGEVVWRGRHKASLRPGEFTKLSVPLPLQRYGVFEVTARAAGLPAATTRICLIPQPQQIPPDQSRIGINLFQQQIWWYAYQAPMMAKAGVRWIRPWLAWENTWNTQEPQPGQWDFRALDAALRRMEKLGLRYQNILFAAPSWATDGNQWGVPPSEKMHLWAAYVEQSVRRYRRRIHHYEVWNEPDLMWPEETRHSGQHYAAMLKATWQAAKRADPNCQILGLSHAGYEEWLEAVGKLDIADLMDIVTIHVYAPPRDFIAQVERRRAILARYGLGDKPLWVNELGVTAYDFSPAYSSHYGCSERSQAWALAALYALALSVGPDAKAFWFCTYDPRDAAHESQWTYDAGIGVLYLGFLPKLSYAALAAVARELDGRECLGRRDITKDLHQVSFRGPVTLVWHDSPPNKLLIPVTELGCLPDERITVRDVFGNTVAEGRAERITINFSAGPHYVAGSPQLAALARAEMAATPDTHELSLRPGESATVRLPTPPEAEVTAEAPGLPMRATVHKDQAGGHLMTLSPQAGVTRVSGLVRVRVHFPEGSLGLKAHHQTTRTIMITVGEPNLIRDGHFLAGNLDEWTPERTSAFAFDAAIGHAATGSLRLDGPFDRRLVHWGIRPAPGHEIRFTGWVKTDDLTDCRATLNIAFFGPERWLTTWCLATSGPTGEIEGGWRTVPVPARIPLGTADWTLLEATLPAELVPDNVTNAAFFIDVTGGCLLYTS
ncbi:MAG: hypothetical protein N2512_15075, partial [Armatimonadetes bacterium]|nr:hypothetical protein [Armatimonadota bacterium]